MLGEGIAREIGGAWIRALLIAAGAGCAIGIAIGLAIGWWLFGGGA